MPAVQRQKFKVLIWVGLGMLTVVLLLHLLAVSVLRSQFEAYLHPQEGQGTYLGDVHLNLFSGVLAIHGVEVRDGRQILLQAAEVSVNIDPLALLRGHVHIQDLQIAGGKLRVERAKDGAFHVLVPIPAAQPDATDEAPGLALLSEYIGVRRFTIEYVDALASEPELLRIESLDLRGPLDLQQQLVEVVAQASWRTATLEAKGKAEIAESPVVDLDLKLQRLPLHRVLATARQAPVARMTVSTELDIQLQADRLKSKGQLQLREVNWQQEEQQAAVGLLGGKQIDLQLPLQEPQSLQLKVGQLQADALNWSDSTQEFSASKLATSGVTLDMPLANPAGLRLGGQGLDASTLAYTQGETRVDIGTTSATGSWQLDLGSQTFSLADLGVVLGRLRAELPGQPLEVARGDVSLVADKAPFSEPRLTGAIRLSAVQARAAQLPGDVFRVESLELPSLQVNGSSLELGGLQAQQLGLQQFPLTLRQLTLSQATLDDKGVALGELVLNELRTELRRDEKGNWLLPVSQGADTAASSAGSDKAEGGTFRLAGIQLQGDSRIHLVDASVKPAIDRDIRIKRLELGAMDSRKPQNNTDLNVSLQPDEYTALDIDGRIRPFSEDLYLDLKGQLSGLELALVNGLVRDDLGHTFLSGHLDNSFQLNIEKRHLKMSNELALQELDVEEIEGKEGPPLSTAIALLEDRDRRIELGVPIEGDLDNPAFKVLGALNPIIAKAVAGAAALAIQPLGSVVLVGGLLASEALKVRFEPARFEPKTANLTNPDNLRELSKKLKEKPKLKLRLCGVAVSADRTLDKKGNVVETDEQLLALAAQRAQTARSVMLAAGVDEQQLRSCRPVLDVSDTAKEASDDKEDAPTQKADSKPRVEIRL